MFVLIHVAVTMLCVLAGARSAPVTSCENLVKPIEIQGRDQFIGKWTYLAESTNISGSRLLTKMFVETAWAKITAANESDAINVFHVQKMLGQCFTLSTKMTLQNSTLSTVKPYTASEVFLNTGCPDCLVSHSKYTIGGRTYSGLQFLSKRNKVTAAEREEFTKQVDCLNLPPPAFLDVEKGFCPDESASQETGAVDLTNFMDDMDSDMMNLLDRVLNSEDGMKIFLNLISGNAAELKEN